MPLRVAAIDFLNPAPLMWDFNHEPRRTPLARRYAVHLTTPSGCARELLEGSADLGLIPIAALTPALHIVPDCAIASIRGVRSIQLVVKAPRTLAQVRTIAADIASRSSVAYAQVILQQFYGTRPAIHAHSADLEVMLATHDAALIIGDPALLAIERRAEIEASTGVCTWYDLAELWHQHTRLPWVAAVWAVRPNALPDPAARALLVEDLNLSRAHGLAHIEDLVAEWLPRIALPSHVIRTYLTENIHYMLDTRCIQSVVTFRQLAAQAAVLPPLPHLNFVDSQTQ